MVTEILLWEIWFLFLFLFLFQEDNALNWYQINIFGLGDNQREQTELCGVT
jgi:hypothetical protein